MKRAPPPPPKTHCHQLGEATFLDSLGTVYRLAHECVHLLALAPDAIPLHCAIEPAFNQMMADSFARAGLNAPPALVTALLVSFPQG
ncbi:hypothetical protein [Erwinia psidii]|uniref:Uncharacterized protein n=1 Tax=Erwinia psidii TaxID=69224 RepID=A0A3N6RXU1_9GAMM|nr:hypothetical protein [Erwinia psidii]MCX8957007.1 hypothetical protein [Erwinia psidii]RQM37934.1 hypothetical protein EB241_11640 [Erwinia psidii]